MVNKSGETTGNRGCVVVAVMMLLTVVAALLLPAGRAIVRCYSWEGGFCGLETRSAFYVADNLPASMHHPGLKVAFVGVSARRSSIYMPGREIRLLFIVRLPDVR